MKKFAINPYEALERLKELGYKPWYDSVQKVCYWYFGNKIVIWCKKGWCTGKGIEDGYGLDNLIDQLKPLDVKIIR